MSNKNRIQKIVNNKLQKDKMKRGCKIITDLISEAIERKRMMIDKASRSGSYQIL